MLDLIKKRWYLALVIVCIIGFAIGYFLEFSPISQVKAANFYEEGVDDGEISHIQYYEDVFSDELYSCSYDDGIVYVSLNNNAASGEKTVYTSDDIQKLNEELLKTQEPMILTYSDDYSVTYEEYNNGYPTGALASYVFDEDGNIIDAYFREGEIYDYTDSIISCEDAYNIAVASIRDKYVDEYDLPLVIVDDSDDFEYNVFYCPAAKQLCYKVNEIAGVITGNTESEDMDVYFYVIVSLDGSYVDVASTLCY